MLDNRPKIQRYGPRSQKGTVDPDPNRASDRGLPSRNLQGPKGMGMRGSIARRIELYNPHHRLHVYIIIMTVLVCCHMRNVRAIGVVRVRFRWTISINRRLGII
jgi:hypothetical protein